MHSMNAIQRTNNSSRELLKRLYLEIGKRNKSSGRKPWIPIDVRSTFVWWIWLKCSKHPNTQIRTLYRHCTSFSLLFFFVCVVVVGSVALKCTHISMGEPFNFPYNISFLFSLRLFILFICCYSTGCCWIAISNCEWVQCSTVLRALFYVQFSLWLQ